MATVSLQLNTSLGTGDTLWRAWGQAVSDAITQVGFAKTSDTGQVNWTTSTNPINGYVYGTNYEIRRFNDSLQGTAPVFMRLDFSSANLGSSLVPPSIRIQLGTGTDGAGGLTGVLSNFHEMRPRENAAHAWDIHGNGTMFSIAARSTTGTLQGGLISLDRWRKPTGEVTPDGVFLCDISSGGSGPTSSLYPLGNQAVPASQNLWPFPNVAFHASYANLDVCLAAPVLPYGQLYTARNVLLYMKADLPTAGTIIQVPMDNSMHTYRCQSDNSSGGVNSNATSYAANTTTDQAFGVAIRWE